MLGAHRFAAVLLRVVPLAVAVYGCVSTPQNVYVAATEHTVELYLEPHSMKRSQYVMITNNSTEDIVVNGVRLSSCTNITNECRTASMRVVVRPRETKRLLEVETFNENQASNFAYGVSWEQAPPDLPALPLP